MRGTLVYDNSLSPFLTNDRVYDSMATAFQAQRETEREREGINVYKRMVSHPSKNYSKLIPCRFVAGLSQMT